MRVTETVLTLLDTILMPKNVVFYSASLISFITVTNISPAQSIIIPFPKNGRVTETCPKLPGIDFCSIRYAPTDKDGKVIGFGYPKIRDFLAAGNTFTFGIPAVVQVSNPNEPLKGEKVFDILQETLINKRFSEEQPQQLNSGLDGAKNSLSIKAIFFDSDANQFILGNIFGVLAQLEKDGVIPNAKVQIPDLFADTNGDGQIGNGDVLYSVVDLNKYLASGQVPAFDFGDSFNIANGSADSLPGMIFSTTPLLFDSQIGITNITAFSGTGIVLSSHDVEPVPEPSTTLSLLALGTLGAASTLKHQLKPSKSTEKEATKIG